MSPNFRREDFELQVQSKRFFSRKSFILLFIYRIITFRIHLFRMQSFENFRKIIYPILKQILIIIIDIFEKSFEIREKT